MTLSAMRDAPFAYVAAEAPRILPLRGHAARGRFVAGGASDAAGDVALKSEAGGLRPRHWRPRLFYCLPLPRASGEGVRRRPEGGPPPCPRGPPPAHAPGN